MKGQTKMSTKQKTAFTPGPWTAKHSGTGDASVIAKSGWTNKDGTAFNPVIVQRIDWPTAGLIAAAPAMYDALKKALDALQRCSDIKDQTRAGWAHKAVDEAIAQAEGK